MKQQIDPIGGIAAQNKFIGGMSYYLMMPD